MPSTIGLNGKWLMSAYHDLSSSIWQYLRARPEPHKLSGKEKLPSRSSTRKYHIHPTIWQNDGQKEYAIDSLVRIRITIHY
jgi:hypothetical protein